MLCARWLFEPIAFWPQQIGRYIFCCLKYDLIVVEFITIRKKDAVTHINVY